MIPNLDLNGGVSKLSLVVAPISVNRGRSIEKLLALAPPVTISILKSSIAE
jgi:hypothetical protein